MKIRIIYLAAGNSRRFGSNKLLYKIDGKPLFAYGLDALLRVLEEREETSLTVVTNYPEIEEYVRQCRRRFSKEPLRTAEAKEPAGTDLTGTGYRQKERIALVKSPDSHKGISNSIRAGLLYGGQEDYYLFCVADQPHISSETVIRLIQKASEGDYIGGFVEWEGRSGNPAIFSKELLPELLALQGDTGGKKLLAGRENVCRVRARRREEMEDVDFLKRLTRVSAFE